MLITNLIKLNWNDIKIFKNQAAKIDVTWAEKSDKINIEYSKHQAARPDETKR